MKRSIESSELQRNTMKQDVIVPEVGESVTSGVLATWIRKAGDQVSEGDDLFELETDKATLSVPAPASGLLETSVDEDSEVQVGQSVGSIDTAATGSEAASGDHKGTSDSGKKAPGEPADSHGATIEDLPPAARRVVEENNLDLSRIEGTGKDGRVTKEDALRAADEQRSGSAGAPAGAGSSDASQSSADRTREDSSTGKSRAGTAASVSGGEAQTRKKLSNFRKRVAANLVQSKQNSAHLTTFNEVDMSKVMEIRNSHKEQFEKKHEIKLGFMSFFVKAAQKALQENPDVNAYLQDEEIVYNHFYNIGVALSSDRGLMTPVIRNVESKSFADVEREIVNFIGKAKNKKLMPDELSGGTFTITNGGVFGSMLSTPIPNPPQTAILGMHTIQKRAVVVDDEIVIRPMMYLALSYDHRMIDGREAIGFLNSIKNSIEDPNRILLDL